jgi:hypothetical protein
MQDVGEDAARSGEHAGERIGDRPEDEAPRRQLARSASSEVTRSRKFSFPVFTNSPTAFSADWKAPTRLWPMSPPMSRALLA